MVLYPLLNHDDLRRWRACSRRFWLYRRSERFANPPQSSGRDFQDYADPSAETEVVYGPGVDVALRASYPLADIIPKPTTPAEWVRAMRQTLHCLDDDQVAPEGWAILGACLTSEDRAQARIDVLTCGERGLRLFKLRYATVADDSDVDTVAFWTEVASRCGLRIQSAGLLLIDTDFIYPGHGCYAGLFREVDLAPVLGSRPVAAWLDAMRSCERGSQPPATPGVHCTQNGGCEFAAQCAAYELSELSATRLVPDPRAKLEIVGHDLAIQLRKAGHTDLHSVSPATLNNARHRRAVRAIQQNAPVLESEVAALMQALPYPRHSLRFDTIGFAVPLWAGTRPYQVLPFQWTCDVLQADGQSVQWSFLADEQGGDPRRAFALSLLQVLGHRGAVLAYNAGFERSRILDLARCFDDLAPALEAVLERLVDLFQVARAHYYHPVMAGSWSFKSISRAVAPDITLATKSQAIFAHSLQRGLDVQTREQLRATLQIQGRQHTEVLRRIAALFEGAASASPQA